MLIIAGGIVLGFFAIIGLLAIGAALDWLFRSPTFWGVVALGLALAFLRYS
jgi:hypothetical protein